MLPVVFNPYPGMSSDVESGKKCLLATANTCKLLSENMQLSGKDPAGNDSIKLFIIAEDQEGIRYTPSSFLRQYSGRKRELVIWFMRMFDKGARLHKGDLTICEDWILCDIEVSAPIIEYAARQNGMVITISDDNDWKTDFFSFINQSEKVPNIHGQRDYSPIQEWIQQWSLNSQDLQTILEKDFKMILCPGASNSCFPSQQESKGLLKSLERAQTHQYEVDNKLIKSFQTKFGNIYELRSYKDGVRLFFMLKAGKPVVGGFYRKSAAISQNKAAEYAAKRLKKHKHL